MRKFFFFILFLITSTTFASHIVGGEFELLFVEGSRYRLNLIIYFDVINGNPGARDPNVTVRVFRKSDNSPVTDLFLPFVQQLRVDYFQPLCSSGEIVTDKLIYSTEIVLNPEIYNEPEGYYVTWERCCRNYTLTNIYSENPQNGGAISAGQTFYLEFPAVVKNGEPFINSSPQLFPPLNDYACPNRPYWVDFAGVDVDEDSLVYTLVAPLNTVLTQALPPGGPHPGPYPKVSWRPGFGINNIMGGNPHLKISNTGFLTVTPGNQGLFVFAVKCEEFRDGKKIGELIRDFQMLVLDQCPVADPPIIKGKKIADARYNYVDNMSVAFPNTTTNEERCIEVEVSDPDALKVEDGFSENVWLHVIPLDFQTKSNLSNMLPTVSSAKLTNGSVHTFELCFDACPLVKGRPYTLGIIAFDDACALPLSDTLRVTVNIEPPHNTPAYFLTADAAVSLKEGNDYQLVIEGKDDENNDLQFDVLTDGFNLADFGMSFDNTTNENGVLNTTFNWATGCDVYDFTKRTNFLIKMVLNDSDLCNYGDADTLTLDLQVILPPNTDPIISTDLAQTDFLNRINVPISFNVFGLDTDDDEVELSVVGKDFVLEDHEISFPAAEGLAQVQSAFSWNPDCDNVSLAGMGNKEFTFYFLLNDLDKCKFSNYDTLEVIITILKPENDPPSISFVNLTSEVSFQAREANLQVGQLLQLEVVAEDAADNEVTLELLAESDMPEGAIFSPNTDLGTVKSVLEWNAECFNLVNYFEPRSYRLFFTAKDNVCFNSMADTVEVTLNISDIEDGVADFEPPNVFTPNKDGINDYYTLPALPLDDCRGRFLSFRVHNRWGTEVYSTENRDFQWDAKGLEAGVYFYAIEFSNKEFNGPLTILY